MTNGNEPISPIVNSDGYVTMKDYVQLNGSEMIGLTKREAFAMAALQGLLANPYPDVVQLEDSKTAKLAVEFADHLINALNQQP